MSRYRGTSPPRLLTAAALAVALVLSACASPPGAGTKPVAETSGLVIASTTSTQDSGLFDVLIPAFERANPPYKVKVIAAGTGEALKLGETKDADVLLVHAKADEEKFVAEGFGTERRDVMYNDFIIVGPEQGVDLLAGSADAAVAFATIAERGADTDSTLFISRGDDSGTNRKELKLWKAAGIATPTPGSDAWYESSGQGMGDTLKIASEKQGYTLADRATYLSMKDTLDLVIVREGDKDLLNQYGVVGVAGARNAEGAKAFADWITSAEGQKVIGDFGVEKYGQALFVPNAK